MQIHHEDQFGSLEHDDFVLLSAQELSDTRGDLAHHGAAAKSG